MRKVGKKLLAVALAGVVLCTGTVTAQAGVERTSVCNFDIKAETTISETGAMARTSSNGWDVYTTVDATFYYIDVENHTFETMDGYHDSDYCSIVYFSLPAGNYESYEICATHTASYEQGDEFGYWRNSTSEKR